MTATDSREKCFDSAVVRHQRPGWLCLAWKSPDLCHWVIGKFCSDRSWTSFSPRPWVASAPSDHQLDWAQHKAVCVRKLPAFLILSFPCFLWYSRSIEGYGNGMLRRGYASETRHPYQGSSEGSPLFSSSPLPAQRPPRSARISITPRSGSGRVVAILNKPKRSEARPLFPYKM
jgi:hypothetical protein